jgi:hypothetical protein
MPAWASLLADEQVRQIVDLLKNVNDKTIPPNITPSLDRRLSGMRVPADSGDSLYLAGSLPGPHPDGFASLS